MRRLLNPGKLRTRIGLGLAVFGFFVFLLGADPGMFNLDRSEVIGFVQITVFLTGLGIICIGGYLSLISLWNGSPKSILSDIGLRLVSTGFVIAVVTGLADVFGFGSQMAPVVPDFGALQRAGVIIGEVVIGTGFFMMIPFPRFVTSTQPEKETPADAGVQIQHITG